MKIFVTFLLSFCLLANAYSQAGSYFDPAQAYNKMLLENGNSYMLIGTYKVKGNPYLYGGALKGKVFINGKEPVECFLSYNLYTQQLFYSSNQTIDPQSLFLPNGKIDSFLLYSNIDLQINSDLAFIRGTYLSSSDSNFYQQVFVGVKYSLYKKYTSDLVIVTTNYMESDLRQFDINYQYYYQNKLSEKLIKLKPTYKGIEKEFGVKIDTVISANEFSYNPEKSLITVFQNILEK